MKPILTALLFVILCANGTYCQTSVYIETDGFGRGILKTRGNECFVITPNHVVSHSDYINVYSGNGINSRGELVESFPGSDLAIVRLTNFQGSRDKHDWKLNGFFNDALEGGSSYFLQLRNSDGSVEYIDVVPRNINNQYVTVSSKKTLTKGMSGSLLFTNYGGERILLGLLQSIDNTNQNIGYVYQADDMMRVLNGFFNTPISSRKTNFKIKSLEEELVQANKYYADGDYDKAFPLLEKLKNHPKFSAEHMKNLGRSYHLGHGTEVDYQKAYPWYEKAASKGNAWAMNNIATLYDNGHLGKVDQKLAESWYLKSATNGNEKGMGNLGGFYRRQGKYQKAIKWLEKAVNQYNSDYALAELGIIYYSGFGVQKNLNKSIDYFERGARLGNAFCAYRLGNLYEYGHEHVSKNYDKSLYWYKASANMTSIYALNELGAWFTFGENPKEERDYKVGVNYYKEAAMLGDSLAQSKLLDLGEVWYLADSYRDKDLDGIFDEDDRCPSVKGRKENKGCPVFKKPYSSQLVKKPYFEKAIYKFGNPRSTFYRLDFFLDETSIAEKKFSSNTHTVLSKALTFYPGYYLIYIYDNETEEIENYLYQRVSDYEDERIIPLNYKSDPIHALNKVFPISLNNENVFDYLYFFFASVKGRHGRFYTITSLEEYDIDKYLKCYVTAQKFTKRLELIEENANAYIFKGTMLFKNAIFDVKTTISKKNGSVTLDEGDMFDMDTCEFDYLDDD